MSSGWNQRSVSRRGYRNGYYRRQLTTSHGVVALKVPRCRQGTLDTTAVFQRYQRRVKDVERILRHAYLLSCATRGLAQLAVQIFGGCLSHQSISVLMRWVDDSFQQRRKQPIEQVYTVVYIDGIHVNRIDSDRTVMPSKGPSLANSSAGIKSNLHIILDAICAKLALVLFLHSHYHIRQTKPL